MRKLFALFFVFFIATSVLFAQQTAWQWVNPVPQGNLLNAFWSYGQDSAVAVGGYGTVIRTTNGGATWHVLPTIAGMTDQLFGTAFASSSTGWAVGEAGQAFKTTDGGATWFRQTLPTVSDLFSVSFVSPTTGWVAGSNGTICYTSNGGTTWSAETSNTTATLYAVSFINSTTGWAVGAGGKIIKTTNGGTTWLLQASGTTQSLYSISLISSTTGWVAGAFGTVLKTNNGGSVWTPQISQTGMSLYGVNFVSSTTGWVVGGFGTIRKTTNGGLTWFEQTSNTYNDLYAMQFRSSTTGWAVGDYGVIVATTDGGVTWQLQSTSSKTELYASHFSSPSNGWVVGDVGFIMRTTDGGITWAEENSGLYQPLYAVYFVSEFIGYAAGDSSVILKTTNGGYTWNDQHSRSEYSLYSIHFISATEGCAVGDFGTILKTSNGGVTWVTQTSNTVETLLRVKFLNSNVGWVVGYGGYIGHTTDAGVTWIPQNSGTTQALYSVEIIDANTAYAAGDFGTILKTTNAGATWVSETSNTVSGFYGITFMSSSDGWVAGDDGTIMNTHNSGSTWETQNSGTINTLYDIQFVRGSQGGVVYSTGIGSTLLSSVISPTPTRSWTGAYDSLWTNGGNWNPIGVPENIDSVLIPLTTTKPVIRGTIQQINLAGLSIATGAKLTIRPGLAQLVLNRNVDILGTLEMDPSAGTEIFAGGNFFVGYGGNFIPGKSTVVLTGSGIVRGNFYNLVISQSVNVQTVGNIDVRNMLTALSNLIMRPSDTLSVRNPKAQSFQGPGTTGSGTIKRAVVSGNIEQYRFESAGTFIQFDGTGVYPDTVLMTVYPNSLPPGFQDTLFVKRYYTVSMINGSNYRAKMSLRYDTAETRIPIDEIAIFRDSSNVLTNIGSDDFVDDDYSAIIVDTVKKFSTFYLGKIDYFPKHPFEFFDSLYVSDNGGITDTVFFGGAPGATDGIDTLMGEALLGPKPPSGTFDARWMLQSNQASLIDLRNVIVANQPDVIYTCDFQPGSGGYPITLRWNPSILPAGTFFLRDAASQGGAFSINMRLQSSYVISNSTIKSVQIVNKVPWFYPFIRGWNMLSLPVTTTTNGRKSSVFPSAVSSAFKYVNNYQVEDTLKNGVGYWLKFGITQDLPVEGLLRNLDTITLSSGWNMIGSISKPVAINSIVKIPSSLTLGNYYQYANGYSVADSIRPAKACWVKSGAAGKLVLSSPGTIVYKSDSPLTKTLLTGLNQIDVRDNDGNHQMLYFGESSGIAIGDEWTELPPLPPQGAFDARFSTQRFIELLPDHSGKRTSMTIEIQSSDYPVTLEWNLNQSGSDAITIADEKSGQILLPSTSASRGRVVVSNPSIKTVIVSLKTGSGTPKEFSLRQNFPNPFNPSTTIQFDVPTHSNVTMKVFNILGQVVATILDNQQYGAGSHSILWDASSVSSGIYFYQMVAQGTSGNEAKFQQVKKLILLK